MKRITGTSLDKSGQLDKLAALPAAERESLIKRAEAGESVLTKRAPTEITVPSAEWRAKFRTFMDEWLKTEAADSPDDFPTPPAGDARIPNHSKWEADYASAK